MNKSVEKQFEQIQEKLMADMESVKCPLGDFLAALEDVQARMSERASQVREELRSKGDGEESDG